jgi:hypothetical protein
VLRSTILVTNDDAGVVKLLLTGSPGDVGAPGKSGHGLAVTFVTFMPTLWWF